MNGDKRNFSLSIWDHKDNFICNLKSANLDFEGQSFNENFIESITGEKTLNFSIPMYIFSYKDKNSFKFEPNEAWEQIKNEQKIRYIEYNPITNEPERIEEFVLKDFNESRNEEEKIAECNCESLAVYELGKIGWGITFDTNYITDYESEFHEENIEGTTTLVSNCSDLLTLDYWMKKLLYKETNLGRVSNTTECTYLLQGLQLRDTEGYPINNIYITSSTYISDEPQIEYKYERIDEPSCTTVESIEYQKYYNPTGWTWEVQAKFENDPERQSVSTLYETPVINKFIETYPNNFMAYSYQKRIGTEDNTKELRQHPIKDEELNTWTYVTEIKKRLITEERSNVFSIIQNICETFQVWADFQYHYDNNGKIDQRKILFKTETIDENIKFDFSYGKNLKSCSRNINSNDLITKLYVTNTDSKLVDGNVLSIQQASANPTGENYLYNFDYFYEAGMLSKEEDKGIYSDEYKINLHYGRLKNINNKIVNLQEFLAPLYDRRNELESQLLVEQSSKIGFIDNIKAIQDKIEAINSKEQIINSWSKDNNQYNHVGELKTYSTTNNPETNEPNWKYLNFGREDIIIESLSYKKYSLNNNNELVEDITIEVDIENQNYKPRVFSYGDWYAGNLLISDNDTTHFKIFDNTDRSKCIYDPSSIGDGKFIKGIYFKDDDNHIYGETYGRIRYKYAPLAYYYLLIKDYWDKIYKSSNKLNSINQELLEIKNKILIYELDLKKLLKNKNELILQFENDYKPFIREGFWEPSEYQSQFNSIIFNSWNNTIFDRFYDKKSFLKDLNLNDSLHKYTKYIDLGNISNIQLDTVELITNDPTIEIPIALRKDYDFKLYLSDFGNKHLLIAISPELIDKYDNIKINTPEYASIVRYKTGDGNTINNKYNWTDIPDNLTVSEYCIYLSNDNIITNKIIVYGNEIKDSNKLELFKDYEYLYESVGYYEDGTPVDLSKSESYSSDIKYNYSLKINLKLTDKTLLFLNENNPHFYVEYGEETTLQYLYNDSVITSKKYSMPQVQYSISVIDLSSLNGYENYKPKIGQKVPIYDIEMNLYNILGFITSISYNFEEKYNTELTITTYNTKFEDIFQKITATVTDISYNSNQIYNAANSFETDGTIRTDVFRKSLQDNFDRVSLGTNNEIVISESTGITLSDRDTDSGVKIIGNGIFLTKDINREDEDIEWKTGITGEGINANALTAGSLDTKQITIWNASEKQARFIWNEEGLFAYGDKFGDEIEVEGASTYQELIDYNKYVKFNQEGLDFRDYNKSGLTLGWQGLNIYTQNGALQLDANNGLELKDDNNLRLKLGRMGNNNPIYGLRLNDTSGNTSFQSDSQGNLWLAKYINIGGSFSTNTNLPEFSNAGIFGVDISSSSTEEMGPIRNDAGDVYWDSEPLRFWAGPRDINTFINEESDFSDLLPENNNEREKLNNSPALSRFRVSKSGRIVASGIDVGGWIGGGSFLRSKNHEAILRSNFYSNTAPVLAIGNKDKNIISGSNYNFRVYQDGSLNIGNGNFVVTSTGDVTANSFQIGMNQIVGLDEYVESLSNNLLIAVNNIRISTVGGYTNTDVENGTDNGITANIGNNYYVGLKLPSVSTDVVYYAGQFGDKNNLTNNSFWVKANGSIKASSGTIGGWNITSDRLSVAPSGAYVGLLKPSNNNSTVIQAGPSSTDIKFKVTASGHVEASDINITDGQFGGMTLNSTSLIFESTSSDSTTTYCYRTGLYTSADDGLVFSAGEYKRYTTKNVSVSTNITQAFRIYEDGTVNMTKLNATGGSIGGWNIRSDYLYKNQKVVIDSVTTNYYFGLHAPSKITDIVIYGGTAGEAKENDEFYVKADGTIKATKGLIGGWNINADGISKAENSYYTIIRPRAGNTSASILINSGNSAATSYGDSVKFAVTGGGRVYFHGGIYGWSQTQKKFKAGHSEGKISKLYTTSGSTVDIEICQGLIVDIK